MRHKTFCQSTHFQVLHYTQNKYLKKTFTKLKILTMHHRLKVEWVGKGQSLGWS